MVLFCVTNFGMVQYTAVDYWNVPHSQRTPGMLAQPSSRSFLSFGDFSVHTNDLYSTPVSHFLSLLTHGDVLI